MYTSKLPPENSSNSNARIYLQILGSVSTAWMIGGVLPGAALANPAASNAFPAAAPTSYPSESEMVRRLSVNQPNSSVPVSSRVAAPAFLPPEASTQREIGPTMAAPPNAPAAAAPLPEQSNSTCQGSNCAVAAPERFAPVSFSDALPAASEQPVPLPSNSSTSAPGTTNSSTMAPATSAGAADVAPLPPLPPLPPTATPVGQPAQPVQGNSNQPSLSKPIANSAALNEPYLRFQGVYIYEQSQSSSRARVYGVYPLSRFAIVGATVDWTTGNAFTDTPNQGINITELYAAASVPGVPNLRFVLGQLDLTSYFDRNSFAKDAASMFFNPVFQTNPALSAAGIGSRQAALVNWSITDNVEAKAAAFSSQKYLENFSVDGFAAELGVRYGQFILRGSFATNRDGQWNSTFNNAFQVNRGNGRFGVRPGDREYAFGLNAELYIPEIKMGIFGRYGYYYNQGMDRAADTFGVGATFYDLFFPKDRLGLAYGQQLSNASLRRQNGDPYPDVFEVYYDVAVLPNLYLGLSFQGLDGFRESYLGVRVRADLDMIRPRRQMQ
jgi:hypothetical protein